MVVMSLQTLQRSGESFGCTCYQLGAPAISLGVLTRSLRVLTRSLGAPHTRVKQSGKNVIVFVNVTGTPGDLCYYLSVNDF
jgi:hypothetical protein